MAKRKRKTVVHADSDVIRFKKPSIFKYTKHTIWDFRIFWFLVFWWLYEVFLTAFQHIEIVSHTK